MNLITVIPITRQKAPPELHYFTASDMPVGAVVSVPLRSKAIHAIVSEVKPVVDVKAEIRSAPYEIRKLGKVRAASFFPQSFLEACKVLADYHASTIGSMVGSLVSEAVLENAGKLPPPLPVQASFIAAASPGAADQAETYAVQGDDDDRLSAWKSLIRQEFARKRSVAFHVPAAEDAKQLFAALEKGIEGYIFLFHPGMPAKKIVEAWKKAADTDHPVVIVAAGPFAILPRGDIRNVIIERENGRGWISRRAPYADIRLALEEINRKAGRSVHLSDIMLRTESLRRIEEHEVVEGSPFKWRSVSQAKDELVDMAGKKGGGEKKPFRAVSPELETLIEKNIEADTRLFILASRRGMSPITVCDDCETVVSCRQCSAPVVLHTSKESGKNFFMCHICGERRSADEECVSCGGWRLSPLGVGIELVEKELKERFKGLSVFKIDADATSTEAKIADAMAKFRAKPGSVLIGTELALSRLREPVEHAAVASLDSLFALPDYRIEERAMYALIRLRALAERTFMVQTRRSDEKVFEYALKGNLSEFYKHALDGRRKLGFPPFETLIKITIEGKKDIIAKHMGEIQAHLAPHEVDVFPAFTAAQRGRSVIHGLLKVSRQDWPDMELVGKLRELPPSVMIKIDPESLL